LIKNYKFKKENYNFWLSRINNSERKVCTNDVNLDFIEEDQIIKNLKNNRNILEIGCGNGLLVKELIKTKKIKKYIGVDFVPDLINFCKRKFFNRKNIDFICKDITLINEKTFNFSFDYIISKRVIQNILSLRLQLKVLDNIGFYLKKNGFMVLVESSSVAQNNINNLRKKYKLKKIIPPFHNLFLDDHQIEKYSFKNIKLKKIENFSTNFYYITRIIYAYYAKNFLKKNPHLNHPFQIIAKDMMTDYKLLNIDLSQIKTYIFEKKT